MNFQDLVHKNNEQEKILNNMQTFIEEVKAAKGDGDYIRNFLFSNVYSGSINNITHSLIEHYRKFREKLISIDAYELGITIVNFKRIYNNPILNSRLDEIEGHYKEISRIKKITESKEIINEYNKCIESLNSILENYNAIKVLIDYINSVNTDLCQGIEETPLRIRFFNENNTVVNLIDNITLINNIYNSVNKLIGSGEELKYSRAESGTFEISLNGSIRVLVTIVPILTLAYKVYTEQFSPKAKLEIAEREIKVRGDYLKLIKETAEIKEKEFQKVITIIADLDQDIKKLYKSNPFIRINDENLGTEELKNKNIPIELLKSADEDIKSLLEEQFIEN